MKHFFQIIREGLFGKLTEVVEVRQLGRVGYGNKLQKQKKGHWSLGERQATVTRNTPGGQKRGLERHGCAPEKESALNYILMVINDRNC